jgi:deazaflavin-dependent oxidoreductase (nitroreductase family)
MSLFFTAFTRLHIWLYRRSGGRIGGAMLGAPILLLTTTGNKSGQPRTVPLMYFADGGKNYIVASAGGSPVHPAWYKNLAARSQVEVQIGPRAFKANAVTVGEDERARIFAKVKQEQPRFAEYELKAGSRQIPVVRLDEAVPEP